MNKNKHCKKRLGIYLLLMVLCFAFSSLFAAEADAEKPKGAIGEEQGRALSDALQGKWGVKTGKNMLYIEFLKDNIFIIGDKKGEYSFKGNRLNVKLEEGEVSYKFEFAKGILTLSEGDLIVQPLKFNRQVKVGEISRKIGGLFDVSWESIRNKTLRIGIIIGIVIASRILIFFMKMVSRLIIFKEWGMLKHLYQKNKKRRETIHSIILNAVKYVIYFSALGLILGEMGVNYAAYFASLSVIGLAVGFGSQGLVKDVVTGFFVLFEAQFDVGDLVEISGQVGRVEELGLRMTKIRNFMGQIVTIPNRNIALVGKFRKGSCAVTADVAVEKSKAEEAKPIVDMAAAEISKQFSDVILDPVHVTGEVNLETDEAFIRVQGAIWPKEQWVIADQLVPRIKEQLQKKEIEVPSDRVAVSYSSNRE